jgi:SAM-dependent methyltransferase
VSEIRQNAELAHLVAPSIAALLWGVAHSVSSQVGFSPESLDIASWWYRRRMAADLGMFVSRLAQGVAPWTIVDVSCGKGLVVGALTDDCLRVVGLDVPLPASDQLNVPGRFWQTPFWHSVSCFQPSIPGRRKNSNCGARFSYYETLRFPFPSCSIDGIIAYAVYEHIEPIDRGMWLSEVARCLKPGGVMLIACCPRPEAITERIARVLGLPCHDYLISAEQLVSDVRSVNMYVEDQWLSHHLPCFLPGVSPKLASSYLAAQSAFASELDDAVGRWTGSRWAHHSNLIARKP